MMQKLLERAETAIAELDLGVRYSLFATEPLIPLNQALAQTGGARMTELDEGQLARAVRFLEGEVE